MIRLHGFARGLLNLLGAQNFGSAPNQMQEFIQPVVDLTRFYQASKISVETLSQAAIAGVTSLFTVPAGELWILEAADVRMSAGAGESVSGFGLVLSLPSNAALFASDVGAVAANQLRWVTLKYCDLVLPPGAAVGYYAEGIVGAVDVFVTVRTVRLTGA